MRSDCQDAAETARRGVILIGTAQTVAAAARQLRDAGATVTPLGAVVLTRHDAAVPQTLPVFGTLDDLERIHANYPFSTALVSLPSAMGGAIARCRAVLQRLGVAERFLPTIHDVLTQEPRSVFRGVGEIDHEAVLGRPHRRMDRALVDSIIKGRRVLITGAGGSIGSEIARIVAGFEPAALMLMERSDNALFEIDRQVAARFPTLPRHAVLHDVIDSDATLRRLVNLRPDVVFHAAAHKHVPLMEDHPAAAVNNNLFGTKSVADAALAVGVERFVLISTDKAVNPTSVMGATKRLAELYVRSLNQPGPGVTRTDSGKTRFSLVRFGNVLGSACSVLPIWTRQIAEGGPVTVTHPEMTRYFMTIPEAAALVIQSAAIAGEVFVLDMGQPVRILDLALNFVRAHGLSPVLEPTRLSGRAFPKPSSPTDGPQIRVAFTGPRPGEKLYEELAYSVEELVKTAVDGVCAWDGEPVDRPGITGMIAELSGLRHVQDRQSVLAALQRHVPELDQTRSYNSENSPKQVVQSTAA
ncbi:MAG: polysaccharide biosynthesis protein [Phycisphaerales bacterium]